MVRIVFYEKIEALLDDYDNFVKVAKTSPIVFNEMIKVNIHEKRRISQKEIEKRKKKLLDKAILSFGLDGALDVLYSLIEMIKNEPPSNNLLLSFIEELIESVEKVYRTVIASKLLQLFSYVDMDLDFYRNKILQVLKKDVDINFFLGLDNTSSLEQFSFMKVKVKNNKKNDLALMVSRRMNIREEIVKKAYGIPDKYKVFIVSLIDLLVDEDMGKYFISLLIKEGDALLQEIKKYSPKMKEEDEMQLKLIFFE